MTTATILKPKPEITKRTKNRDAEPDLPTTVPTPTKSCLSADEQETTTTLLVKILAML